MLSEAQRRILTSIRDHKGDPFEETRRWNASQPRWPNPGGAESAFRAVMQSDYVRHVGGNRYVITPTGEAALVVDGLTLPAGDRWAACSAAEFPAVGRMRHVVAKGALSSACSATASHPSIWRANRTKPACPECVRAVWPKALS